MSTEVESSQLDSGLTAAACCCSGGGAAETMNRGESGDGGAAQDTLVSGKEEDGRGGVVDVQEKCNETDKENEQSGNADSAVETVKRKVVEAPPPKVNAWTKRTTGRVPINNINSSSHEKGELVFFFSPTFKMHVLTDTWCEIAPESWSSPPPYSSLRAAAAQPHSASTFLP